MYMSVLLEKFPGKAKYMLYMYNIRLAASRVGHYGWSVSSQEGASAYLHHSGGQLIMKCW